MTDFADVGGWFAILTGAALLGTLLSAALMPKELQKPSEPHDFWTVLSEDPTAHLAFHWTNAAYGLLGIAVIPAVYELAAVESRPWAWYAGALGFVGLAVTARSHLLEVAWDRHIIRRYADGGDAYQRAVHVVAGYGLDVPDGFLQHGAVGAWVLISSLLGLAADSIPVGLGLIGIAAAALAALTVTGYMAWTAESRHAPGLVAVGIGAGTLIEAVWFVWLGAELLG